MLKSRRPPVATLPIEGPLEVVDGAFCLRIPLEVCGEELIPLTKGIGRVDGDTLTITVPDFMMKFLNLRVGGLVTVDIVEGKFNMKSSEWKPGDPPAEVPPPGYVHPR
jgi:hypothetical protein